MQVIRLLIKARPACRINIMKAIDIIINITCSIVLILCSSIHIYVGFSERTGKKIPFFEKAFDLLDAVWWNVRIFNFYIKDLFKKRS